MTVTVVLAGILGFIIALLRGQWKQSKIEQDVGKEDSIVERQQGELINTQEDADAKVKEYLDSLAKLDPKHWGNDDGGGNVH